MNDLSFQYRDGRLDCVEERDVPREEWPAWWRGGVEFIESIRQIPRFSSQGDPDPAWRVFETRNDVRNVAWRGSGVGNLGDARNDAWDAVLTVAHRNGRNSARKAISAAAIASIGNINDDAALDAVLLASILVCDGINLDERHAVHARARWDVWMRGFGLLCDVDGVLYVYRRIA